MPRRDGLWIAGAAVLLVLPGLLVGATGGGAASAVAGVSANSIQGPVAALAAARAALSQGNVPAPIGAASPGTAGHWSGPIEWPSDRSQGWLAWDGADKRVVLFGGTYGGSYYGQAGLNDTWYFLGGKWLPVTTGVAPPAFEPTRFGSSQIVVYTNFVYDSADGYVLLTGSDVRNESWGFSHGSWSHLAIGSVPTGLDQNFTAPTLVDDPASGFVLLVGVTLCGRTPCAVDWSYNAGNWTLLHPSHLPSSLTGAQITYDPSISSVVLYGGYDSARPRVPYQNRTWAFQAGDWHRIGPPGGPSGFPPGYLVYDPALRGLLLVADKRVVSTESWLYANGTWQGLGPGSKVNGESSTAVVFDPSDRSVELLAGDVWYALANRTWTSTSAPAPVSTYVPATPIAYDPLLGAPVTLERAGPRTQIWEFLNGTWVTAVISKAPVEALGSLAFDPGTGCLVAFGGAPQALTNATWTYCNGTWTQDRWRGCPTFPQPTWGASLVYDGARGEIVEFGGVSYVSPTSFGTADDNTTWVLHAGCWTPAPVARAPPARTEADLVYDGALRELVLYGGLSYNTSTSSSNDLGDVWTYTNGTWTNATPGSGGPTPRSGDAFAYDPALGESLLYGGVAPNGSLLGDLWGFGAGGWASVRSTPVLGGPGPRTEVSWVYDPAARALLLTGGRSYDPYYYGTNPGTISASTPWYFS